MVIKSVKPLSVAKIAGVLYALLGLIIGACFSLVGMVASSFANSSESNIPPMFGAMFGAAAIIIMPIFYGVIGFIFALIGAVIYNIVAKMTGGIEIETA
jgi:hypothetical protein